MDLSSAKAAGMQAQRCQVPLVLEDALQLRNTVLAIEYAIRKL